MAQGGNWVENPVQGFPMLTRLTRGFRARAAIFVAVLYGLCAILPALTITISSAAAAHCLTEGHQHGAQSAAHTHASGSAHGHDDGAQHEHGSASDDVQANPAQCCGIACISALPASLADLSARPLIRVVAILAGEHDIAGLTPDLLYRPPISLLSH
jgi:hypothetical protein